MHLPELIKSQRLDAPYLREPPLPWVVAAVDAKGAAVLIIILCFIFYVLWFYMIRKD
jgi:hypothetical protein